MAMRERQAMNVPPPARRVRARTPRNHDSISRSPDRCGPVEDRRCADWRVGTVQRDLEAAKARHRPEQGQASTRHAERAEQAQVWSPWPIARRRWIRRLQETARKFLPGQRAICLLPRWPARESHPAPAAAASVRRVPPDATHLQTALVATAHADARQCACRACPAGREPLTLLLIVGVAQPAGVFEVPVDQLRRAPPFFGVVRCAGCGSTSMKGQSQTRTPLSSLQLDP